MSVGPSSSAPDVLPSQGGKYYKNIALYENSRAQIGDVIKIELLENAARELREDCLHDLFLTDPVEDKNALKRKKGNRAADTCEWILRTKLLTTWLDTGQVMKSENPATDILWLYGNPGSGKSIMSIFLAEELSNRFSAMDGKTLSYFFCDSSFDKRKTATSVIRGLLWRLLQEHPPLLEYVLPKYAERRGELFKSFDALWAIFMDIAADRATGRKYCIIDALDECDRESQDILLREIAETFGPASSLTRVSNIRILITSRPYPEIGEYLREFTNKNIASFRESTRDIQRFINEKVAVLMKRKHYSKQVTNQVTNTLKDKAEGTFLWIGLACEELDKVASKDAVNYLQALPKGLHSLYKRLLDTALEPERGERDTIKSILSSVVASLRPLSLSELSVACRLHEEKDEETRIQSTRDEVASCRLMLIIQDDKVLLLHQSVKDFLVGSRADRFIHGPEAHAGFAHRCVDQLIWWHNQEPNIESNDSFLSYSAQFWADHARMAHPEFIIKKSEATFFKIHSDCREHWLAIYRAGFDDSIASRFSIFHVAGHWGIRSLVEFALDSRNYRTLTPEYVDTDYIASDGVSPLEEAARSGHKDVITCLLSREKNGSTVRPQIQIAAARNEKHGKEVLELLFDQRGDITEEVVKAAMQNWTNGVELIRLLLQRRGDQIIVTEEIVKAAAQNWMNGTELMALLLDWRHIQVRITDGLVITMAESFDDQVFARLLNRWGNEITITPEVIKAASGNEQNGKEVVALLLDRRGNQVPMTEDVVRAAAGNEENGEAVMALLLDRLGGQITITEKTANMIAQLFNERIMALLLDRWGDQITITEGVIEAAASNKENSKAVIALLLGRRGNQITITEGVVKRIAQLFNEGIMTLLLDRWGEQITITEGVIEAAASNKENSKAVMALLLGRRGDQITITEGVMMAAANNSRSGKEVITLLLDQRGDQITITEGVVEAAAGNRKNGKAVMALLLCRRERQITITTEAVKTVAQHFDERIMALLLDRWGDQITITEEAVKALAQRFGQQIMRLLLNQRATQITITNDIVKAAVTNSRSGKEVMALLLDRWSDEIPITEDLVGAADNNSRSGKEVMALLLDRRSNRITITEGVVKRIAQRFDEKILTLLLDRWGDQITITDAVIEAAASNEENGKAVMAILLDRRRNQITITEGIVKATASNEKNGEEVMALILRCRGRQIAITTEAVKMIAQLFDERIMALLLYRWGDQITITEDVVEAAAGNAKNGEAVMALLLGRRGDQITITEGVMMVAANNSRSGREVITLLLDRRGDQIAITEAILKAAAGNAKNGEAVMALLLDRRGDQIAITKAILKAAAGNAINGEAVMALLLGRRGDQITITEGVMMAAANNSR
ncbi:unnamed protein product, partial [Clonostachys rhizophaga]